MTEVVYYVAASLDGYIAGADGGVDWLSAVERPGEDYGYATFFAAVDALIMGSATYEQVLGFGAWPYGDKPCWVLTQRPLEAASPGVIITPQSPAEIVAEMEERQVKRAWLVGGSAVAASFRAQGLVSEYVVSVIPTILGEGIPLFAIGGPQEALTLIECRSFESGLVQLTYESAAD